MWNKYEKAQVFAGLGFICVNVTESMIVGVGISIAFLVATLIAVFDKETP